MSSPEYHNVVFIANRSRSICPARGKVLFLPGIGSRSVLKIVYRCKRVSPGGACYSSAGLGFQLDRSHVGRRRLHESRMEISLWIDDCEDYLDMLNKRCAEIGQKPRTQWSVEEGLLFGQKCSMGLDARLTRGLCPCFLLLFEANCIGM
jgi:hypothetical protein